LQRGWCFSLQASCPFGFENKESPKAIPNVATREPLPITPYAPAPSSLPSAHNLGPGFFHHIPACHHDNMNNPTVSFGMSYLWSSIL
jgi:hypothetical protein